MHVSCNNFIGLLWSTFGVKHCHDGLNVPAIISSLLDGHSTDVFLGNTGFRKVEGTDVDLPQVSLVGVHVITRAVVEADTLTFTCSQAHT